MWQTFQMLTCACCPRQDRLKFCSKCRAVKYCSKECQISDWKAHKAICRKDSQPLVDLLARQQDTIHQSQTTEDSVRNVLAPTRQITSLYMSKIDMSLRDGRWLQYFSDDLGLSELDLSRYIGNDDGEWLHKLFDALVPLTTFINMLLGQLVWGSTNFHLTTARAQLINGHVLAARVYRADSLTLVDSWINLDTYIHCDDEVSAYDPDRVKLGDIIWPWTMNDYHVHFPRGELIIFVESTRELTDEE